MPYGYTTGLWDPRQKTVSSPGVPPGSAPPAVDGTVNLPARPAGPPAGADPPPYWPPPGGSTPPAGYGYPIYGGPGSGGAQRPAAGYPGAINYPRPGNTYPVGGGMGRRPAWPGWSPYNLNRPSPGMAYDALARRSY